MNQGEFAALFAALLWTFSSMLWGKINLPAFTLNACKNCIGCVLIVGHLIVSSLIFGGGEFTTSLSSWGWLGASGLIGIVVGDTLYFRSLQILGPRRALIVACFSPLFATVLGYLFLEERIGPVVFSGILLTMAGVIAVVSDRRADVESPGLMPGNFGAGIACGVTGAVCQAVGGLFSKQGMQDCGALEATMIRLLIAGIATVAFLMVRKKDRASLSKLFQWTYLQFLLPATAMGTWLGIWFSQKAYKFGDLAVAQTLLSTCPLFAIPVVWFFYGHKASRFAIAGTTVALFGIWLTVSAGSK